MKRYKLDIIYEDKYIVIINKECNLLTIATDKDREHNLYKYVSDYLKQKNKNNKIFIVHRLDKDTSGLVMFAKSIDVKNKLQSNWNNVIRRYYAVVHGDIKEKDRIESFLRETKTFLTYSSSKGDLAITEYSKISSNKKYSLVDINILTGRKNQIRVHMKDNNTPIVGDKKYGIKDKANRMYLIAYYLCFTHPITNEKIELSLDLPDSFKNLMK